MPLHSTTLRTGTEDSGNREGEVNEKHDGLRAQKRPLPGTRPEPLAEVSEPQAPAATVGYVAARPQPQPTTTDPNRPQPTTTNHNQPQPTTTPTDPGVIPCLAKGISAGRFVGLALAYSVGAGKKPNATLKFKLDECAGTRRDFVVACPNALAASSACWVTDRWFSPQFSLVAEFRIHQWTAEVSCPRVTQPVWACLLGGYS